MSLLPGRLYVMVHDDWAPALAVAGGLLTHAGQGTDRVWVTQRNPAAELSAPTGLVGELRALVSQGEVRVFMRSVHPGYGAARVLEELDHFHLGKPSLVIIDTAQEFLGGVADAAALQRWAEQRGCTLVLLCPRDENGNLVEALRSVADHLAGFARLRSAGEALWWDTFHWFGRSEFTANRTFHVTLDAEGAALFDESVAAPRAAAPAADEELVLASAQVLNQGDLPPARWRVLEEFDELAEASVGARAATVILAFGAHTSVDLLSRQVFDLRRTAGRRLKIVVREMKLRLRHNQEQLLLRLGANLVVPAELGFSRLLALVDTVQGQLFTQPLPGDYAAALTDVIPLFGQGYLPPARFAEAVSATVERSRQVGIHNALVRLPLPPGLTAVDALGYCTMTRPGDICTADDENLYLFLFACRETDVEMTLGRVFDMAVTELFDDETRSLAPEAIRRAADELAARAARLPDLSHELTAGRGRSVRKVTEAPVVIDVATSRGPAASAVRRPLKVRGATHPSEVA